MLCSRTYFTYSNFVGPLYVLYSLDFVIIVQDTCVTAFDVLLFRNVPLKLAVMVDRLEAWKAKDEQFGGRAWRRRAGGGGRPGG